MKGFIVHAAGDGGVMAGVPSFVVLLCRHRADEATRCRPVGEDSRPAGARAHLFVQRPQGVFRSQFFISL